MAPPTQGTACHSCKRDNTQTYSCIQCNNLSFCNDCWSRWVLHQPGAVGYDGRPHEKANAQVVQRLRQILDPARNENEHESELQLDDDTTWFGVGRDASNQAIFQDYGRFATLMSESQTPELGNRYPQLVSFIGQTGAGKSTLIKMLIDRLDLMLVERNSPFPSPVTSSSNDRVPTTGDVHLYADPLSYYTKGPILYADCEGLDGGEAIPRGLRHRGKEKHYDFPTETPPPPPVGMQRSGRARRPSSVSARASSASRASVHIEPKKKLRKCRHASQRDIAWAVTPETKKREYAVTQLYPRLLYTFSDVVVFVLRNPRAFESTVLEKLLDWGSASIDKSLNQPALPHAIIVLNATENVDEKEWDVNTATNLLLDDIRGAIFREPRFEEHACIWRESGRKIDSTKDLLECYYASITIVRIPSRGRYMLMDDQVGKLFNVIKQKCQASLFTKKRVRMLATAEKLQIYLQAAYDHFSKDLDTPFDFIKEALKHNPIPRDFGGNILNLALSIKNNCQNSKKEDIASIFDQMVPMISACIMLDSVRQNLMGTTVQLLNDAYVEFCELALDEFANLYSPCSFVSSRHGRCCNVKSGHLPKGHQSITGRIIGAGGYQSDFDYRDYSIRWINKISTKLQDLQSKFFELSHTLKERPEGSIAAELHKHSINDFYRSLGNDVTLFISHSTCFSCLRELPEHALPCGHVLCLPCVRDYGIRVSKTTIELKRCPLHLRDTFWDPPWAVTVKPANAGVRVLCLDGGGIRGIVELQTLKAIERYLGPKLPIQYFFDLIVGTSTGGIIALGLGVNNWRVDECIGYFKELCRQAFMPREMIGIPILEKLAILNHGSMYKTKPFEAMLERAFTSRPLFGGANDGSEMLTKVAITTTSAVSQHAVVLTNYNRPDTEEYDLPYRFNRSNGPTREFKVWEAARATSAAPPFFKPYMKPESQTYFLDGALYHNNPVWVAHHERKLIWGDVATAPPDILLSLGTGKNDTDTGTPSNLSSLPPEPDPILQGKQKPRNWNSFPRQLISIAINRFDKLLECNTIWNNYLAENSSSDFSRMSGLNKRRFIRINPDLRFKVPRLDAVDELNRLEKAAFENLHANSAKVKEVAHRLIASSFFFEKDQGSVRPTTNGYECTGSIHCRFANSSDEMKAMGEFLRKCLRAQFEPFFVVEEQGFHEQDMQITISENMINDMYLRGIFQLGRIRIRMSKELAVTTISLALQMDPYPHSANSYLPISGFPRELVGEESEMRVSSPKPRATHARPHSGEQRHLRPHRFQSFRDRMKLEKRSSSISTRQLQTQTQNQNQTQTQTQTQATNTNTTSTSTSSMRMNNIAESMAEITIAHYKPTSSTGSGAAAGSGASLSVPPVLDVPFSPTDVGKWAKDRVLSHEEFICELEA